MKEWELSVGDWVHRHYNSIYEGEVSFDFKVTQMTRHYGDELLIWGRSADGKHHGNIGGVSSIEPIPLTADILEKNGFKKHNRYQYIYKDNYCKVCVSFAPRIEIDGKDLGEPPINVSIEGALFDINMNMSAIHELQHLIRLCGIEKEIII